MLLPIHRKSHVSSIKIFTFDLDPFLDTFNVMQISTVNISQTMTYRVSIAIAYNGLSNGIFKFDIGPF